jgi:hypothetical protein
MQQSSRRDSFAMVPNYRQMTINFFFHNFITPTEGAEDPDEKQNNIYLYNIRRVTALTLITRRKKKKKKVNFLFFSSFRHNKSVNLRGRKGEGRGERVSEAATAA